MFMVSRGLRVRLIKFLGRNVYSLSLRGLRSSKLQVPAFSLGLAGLPSALLVNGKLSVNNQLCMKPAYPLEIGI